MRSGGVSEATGGRIAGFVLIAAGLAAIEWAVASRHIRRALVPAPSDVFAELVHIIRAGDLWAPLGQTLFLLAIAYIVASAAAIAVGLAMGRSRALFNLLEPLVEIIRPLPKPALLPPLILFMGIGSAMKITIVGLAVFFPVLINTVQGVHGIDAVMIGTARTFGYGRFQIARKIALPAALPFIFTGLRVSLGLGLILVVVAEMLAGTGGVGYLILDMQRTFQARAMYAWLVILACLGFALNSGFVFLERRILFWSAGSDR